MGDIKQKLAITDTSNTYISARHICNRSCKIHASSRYKNQMATRIRRRNQKRDHIRQGPKIELQLGIPSDPSNTYGQRNQDTHRYTTQGKKTI